jgi:hypothetical protein
MRATAFILRDADWLHNKQEPRADAANRIKAPRERYDPALIPGAKEPTG